jgi:hypothetical protein
VVTASESSVQPGDTVLFRISTWAFNSNKNNGTITTTMQPTAFGQPTFTVGGCASKTSCTVSLPKSEPLTPNAEAEVVVPKSAPAGDKIAFTATVTVVGEPALKASQAAVVTVIKAASPSQSPNAGSSKSPNTNSSKSKAGTPAGSTATTPGTAGTTYSLGSSLPLGPLPGVGAAGVPGISTTLPAGNASNLFPQINPSATPSPGSQAISGKGRVQPVADSSTIPLSLSSSEFGAQIFGLIMLLLGAAIAVTRFSLRKTLTAGKGGTGN